VDSNHLLAAAALEEGAGASKIVAAVITAEEGAGHIIAPAQERAAVALSALFGRAILDSFRPLARAIFD